MTVDVIRQWVLGLAGAALVGAAASVITPEGRVKKVVTLVCGIVTILALISPLGDLDYPELSRSMARYRENARAQTASAGETGEMLARLIIEDECAAYILDKGAGIGIAPLELSVLAKWSTDGYWYPYGAEIRAPGVSESARRELTRYIEAGLGIPEQMQNWYTESGDEGDA